MKKNMQQVLTEVKEFIRLVFETPEDGSFPPYPEVLFAYEEGGIGLHGELAARYRQCLHDLVANVQTESISDRALEQLFQRTLLSALDIQNHRQAQSFEARLNSAIQELRKTLNAEPALFRVYYPVENLETSGLPIKYGNVQFCVFDTELKNNTLSNMRQLLAEPNQNLVDHYEALLSRLSDRVVGVIDVTALETEAAVALAQRGIQRVLDIINYFSRLLNWPSWVYLPGNGEKTVIGCVVWKTGEIDTGIGNYSIGPLQALPLAKLCEADNQSDMGFLTVGHILAGKNPSDLQDRLLSAISWAGKAVVSNNRNEDSFLSYAVALESLLLAENEQGELQYRLITRIAHLIGTDLASRRKISSTMKDLYKLRSRIVHSGRVGVTDADLGAIRFITQACIHKVLTDPAIARIKTIQDWTNWFEDRILDAPE